VIYELPRPVQSASLDVFQKEYPSGAFSTSSDLCLSDGCGTLYVFSWEMGGKLNLVSVCQLPSGVPFRILSLGAWDGKNISIMVSSKDYNAPQPDPKKKTVVFDISMMQIAISMSQSMEPQIPPILWTRKGTSVPSYTSFQESKNSFLLIGECVYEAKDMPTPVYEPKPEEYAPIPRKDENLDDPIQTQGLSAPPPYSWTQTSDSITVVFPLPSSTSKTAIRLRFGTQSLDLHILGQEENALVPRYSAQKLWDAINASTSYWTWDKEGEHEYGLLTLYLDKRHEDTKWMHVFEYSEGEQDVPETLDPSELHVIRESMEKFTASLQSGEDASGLGLGRGVPRMAEGEFDDEVDSSVGKTVFQTWVAQDGSDPSWFDSMRQPPSQLLSTPLPAASSTSLIVKNDLDGLVFSLPNSADDGWKHKGTYSALAFVLASKRDTRFTYHIEGKAVFAFEDGQRDRGGNVYIYRAAPTGEKWAKQAILKVSDGTVGSLLGVGKIQDGRILCLLEKELLVIQGL
jgi:hypothetical protein